MPWNRRSTHRRPFLHGLVHHSDRGSQYVSIRYTERLAEAGIEPSVGSVGDSYDNALAETVIGLFKTEVIRRRGPWRHAEAVEFATLEWVDWFNHRRLLETHRQHPSRRSRGALLCPDRRSGHGRLTQAKSPPENPERFRTHHMRDNDFRPDRRRARALAQLLRRTLEFDPYPMAPRLDPLKSVCQA